MLIALPYHVLLDLEVAPDEIGPVAQVGHNAADKGGGEDHGIRLLGIEKCLDGGAVEKVELGVGAADEIGVAP